MVKAKNIQIVKEGDYVITMNRGDIYAGVVKMKTGYWGDKYLGVDNLDGTDWYNLMRGTLYNVIGEDHDTFLKVTKAEFNKFKAMSNKEQVKYCKDKGCVIGEVLGHTVREICGYYIFGCGAVVLTAKELQTVRDGYNTLANMKLPKGFEGLKRRLEEQDNNLLDMSPSDILKSIDTIFE